MNSKRVHDTILNELHHRLEELPKALGRIAQYVLTNPEKVVHQSIAELSDQSGSGQASIVRLVQLLGLDGFSEFKAALNIELSRRPVETMGDESTLKNIANMLAAKTIADANETARLLGESDIQDVAEHLVDSDHIWIFGSAVAGLCAELLQYRLLRLGLAATAIRDPIVSRELSSQIKAPAVAIAISDSGRTAHSIGFLRNAASRGAYTVAISSRATSELAEHATVLLQTGATGGTAPSANVLGVITRNSQVIETLAEYIEQSDKFGRADTPD